MQEKNAECKIKVHFFLIFLLLYARRICARIMPTEAMLSSVTLSIAPKFDSGIAKCVAYRRNYSIDHTWANKSPALGARGVGGLPLRWLSLRSCRVRPRVRHIVYCPECHSGISAVPPRPLRAQCDHNHVHSARCHLAKKIAATFMPLPYFFLCSISSKFIVCLFLVLFVLQI